MRDDSYRYVVACASKAARRLLKALALKLSLFKVMNNVKNTFGYLITILRMACRFIESALWFSGGV